MLRKTALTRLAIAVFVTTHAVRLGSAQKLGIGEATPYRKIKQFGDR